MNDTDLRRRAESLLRAFTGDAYVFGPDCLPRLGALAAGLGRRTAVIAHGAERPWGRPIVTAVLDALRSAGAEMTGPVIAGTPPNAPYPEVLRMAEELRRADPEVVVAVGGGSTLDAAKAAVCQVALGGDLEGYFGAGRISDLLARSGRRLRPLLAVQVAAGSAAHLTKYANLTDPATAQKKLIIDAAIVPPRALFDYRVTTSAPPGLTVDGALDGLSHCLEVFYGATAETMPRLRDLAETGIGLVLNHVAAACRDGGDLAARTALGLATDLGGQAIMIGGTSGAHLTSFSLVDVLSHGRACAMLNPYYTVFFAPAIQPQLRLVAGLLRQAGYLRQSTEGLSGRDLGLAVAEGLQAVATAAGMPTRLAEVPGFTDAHIIRALAAAKNPQLESKLKNMPVPLTAALVDEYMGPVLEAARTGDFTRIRNLKAA